jgi:hypothetical protein
MYVRPNFKTKKALKEAVKAWVEYWAKPESERTGPRPIEVVVFCPGVGSVPENGRVTLEGPWYPEPHKWYAQGTMKGGKLVSVK